MCAQQITKETSVRALFTRTLSASAGVKTANEARGREVGSGDGYVTNLLTRLIARFLTPPELHFGTFNNTQDKSIKCVNKNLNYMSVTIFYVFCIL